MTQRASQMVRNAALNPTSVPFFPGPVGSFRDDDLDGFEPDARAASRGPAASFAPQDMRDTAPSRAASRQARTPSDDHHGPPAFRQVFSDRAYPAVEHRSTRETSLAASIDSIPEEPLTRRSSEAFAGSSPHDMFRDPFAGQGQAPARERFMSFQGLPARDPFGGFSGSSHQYHHSIPESADESWDAPMPAESELSARTRPRMGSEPFLGGLLTRPRERLNGASMAVPAGSYGAGAFSTQPNLTHRTSASPVSSVDSISHASSGLDGAAAFDAQLGQSPLIHDILDRLVRCESSTRAIQRDLGDVSRKMDMLLERAALSPSAAPEFRNPFAGGGAAVAPRGSFGGGGLPPHQADPAAADMSAINARLNTLTSSLGQLLALQTQNMGMGAAPPDASPQMHSPPSASMLRGVTTRGVGAPSPGNRTWSMGNLDVAGRAPSEHSPMGTNSRLDGRGKTRNSVMGLARPHGVSALQSPSAAHDAWPSPTTVTGSPRGETGPVLSKWEQLALAPALLASLTKFGVGPPNKIQQRALPFLLKGADIIAQAPPTQERIAAYVIPAIQAVLGATGGSRAPPRGPLAILVSTTVDQATQAQRMIRDLGGPIGVRSALGVGAAGGDVARELGLLAQNMPHILCGTPQKLHALFTGAGGLPGADVRFLVLDEVDQLLARNLHEFVYAIVKLLPPPRRGSPGADDDAPAPERQTALFSNTVPQDVLNLANVIELREPVRVLVRRDGTVAQADAGASGAKGLKQFYLFLSINPGGRAPAGAPGDSPGAGHGIIGSGRGAASAETAQAREWKLDALADLFDDVEVPQAIVHVGGMTALDAVVYKLVSRGVDAVSLHGDMNAAAKAAALAKFRGAPTMHMRQHPIKVLVVYDVQLKSADVSQIPLVVNYDLPKAVEEYAHRVAPGIASNFSRPGVVINFVTAAGGDVEMLRSIECYYKIKCPEIPMTVRDIF